MEGQPKITAPPKATARQALEAFLGHWVGHTELVDSHLGPARTAEAEMTFTAVAGGHAVVQSYRHVEEDGSHFEGHGIFSADPGRGGTLWYYVDSLGGTPEVPSRGTWHKGTLTVERQADRGIARHTFRVEDDVLTHTTELRLGEARAFSPVLRSTCRRAYGLGEPRA
ncbi:DUF1579 family protein [Arthrobacter sp. ISL-30]|uniref:DUF1579 family protein n=1 Tax=Arthrobacter sp. ISL-30 TaxID=2819109 RepID=UPI001BEA04A8|nr:DUF1579 family protein [Arthrobacter sp. ISL-30]MBT2514266.1 DUF1579 family protein [Arthrobacter sp. ISL-30]